MQLKTLTKTEAKIEFENYLTQEIKIINNLDISYSKLRNRLLEAYEKHKDLKKYQLDLNFGLEVYNIFNEVEDFGLFYASNYDFWRYICVKVVPDIVKIRHGTHPSHFYENNLRLYISTLWWYVHLSWQGSVKSTCQILKDNNTDIILNLVERPGKQGIYIEATRLIMFYYSKIKREERNIINNERKSLFRQIMILYLAKILVIIPSFHEGGTEGFVKMLYAQFGFKL